MSNVFKIGDAVRIIKDTDFNVCPGSEGIIIGESIAYFRVRFTKVKFENRCEEPMDDYLFDEEEMELIWPEKKSWRERICLKA